MFESFFTNAAKLKICNTYGAKPMFLRIMGLLVCIICVTFLKLCSGWLSGYTFCSILTDFGLQMGTLLKQFAAYFADFACFLGGPFLRSVLEDLWGRAGGRGEGLLGLRICRIWSKFKHAQLPLRGCGES